MIGRLNRLKWWRIYTAGAGICLLISVVTCMTVIGPAIRQRHESMQRARLLVGRRHQAALLSTRLASAQRQEQQTKTEIARERLVLDRPELLNRHLARITQTATECALSIEQIQPGKTRQSPYASAVELKLAGTGSFASVTRFLHRVHVDLPDVGVSSIDLSAATGSALAPQTSFRLELLWFAAPQGGGLPVAGATGGT